MSESNILPEIVIIYLDLITELLTKKEIVKAIEQFMKEKREINSHSKFNLFYFIEGNDPLYSEELTDIQQITTILEQKWSIREKAENYFENGLFFCVSKFAELVVRTLANYRILVISDLPSKKNSEYSEALMNLVETIRSFPTFIDIIRIGHSRLYPDDVKLRIITTITAGGLFYCENEKDLRSILHGLVRNKALPDLLPDGGQIIPNDKKPYFERLALNLSIVPTEEMGVCKFCESNICNFCNSVEDIPKKCPNCNKLFHECCAALYAWRYNIGLKYIFRCPECNTLIKLNEKFVKQVNGEDDSEKVQENDQGKEKWIPPAEEKLEKESKKVKQHKIKQSEVSESTTSKISEEIPLEKKEPVQTSSPQKFGLFGPKIALKKTTQPKEVQPEENQPKQQPTEIKSEEEEKISVEQIRERRKRSKPSVIVCPVCSTYIKPDQKKCPKCSTPI